MDALVNVTGRLTGIIWSTPLIVLCLLVGLVYTVVLKGFQITKIKEMIGLLGGENKQETKEGLSSFQSFCLSVGTRVGTGNILGVISAIATGGPGAVFWMWILGILGAATSFAEHSIAQLYKRRIDGIYRGGTAFFIRYGIGGAFGAALSVAFAFLGYLSTGVLGALQPGACTDALHSGFDIPRPISAVIVAILVFAVLYGGIRQIGFISEKIVPIMSVLYLLIAIVIVIANITKLPGVLATIVTSAFGTNAVFGGIVGTAINMGVKRGVYSSEAGQGTSTPHSATADVSHPAKQGLVQALSVYVVTILICSASAFMILLPGTYNVEGTAGAMIYEGLPGIEAGITYAQAAADTVIPGFGKYFMATALFLFAFTTAIGQYNIAETNAANIYKGFAEKKSLQLLLKLIYMVPCVIGGLLNISAVWGLSDIGMGLNAWVTLLTLLYFVPTTLIIFKDYYEQKAQGIDPVFRPSRYGIKNAELWEEIADEYEAKRKK
ncbi:alanine/glycine:cation symporter family protein [Sinanaerobacter chloroacetimidivorans]|uniref:Alanine:cation symporter family protein n=1 Tax=Sinanaerobacter chloroacetimidivorans TaxID=2818044 RepID=A0A8J7VZW2_9FIRM|nr:alanine/glycine:cation symporter family protein [Sinanaerobacter chloroacetimidivorans]MBR0596435.1 alanine:cation symporter family protein [Sinanaerobacter chloroacetimidivorans]